MCVNPSHLKVSTDMLNSRDRLRDGMTPMRKLDMKEARRIRALFAKGRSVSALAAEFAVNPGSISRLVRGHIYKEDDQHDTALPAPGATVVQPDLCVSPTGEPLAGT
jgi:hypothetical protein